MFANSGARDVFMRKPKESPGLPVIALMGLNETKGEVGIELEFEAESPFPIDGLPKQWTYKEDGSLKGAFNAEYVLRKPLDFAKVPQAIVDLWEVIENFGTTLVPSNRTSVHVHLNVQKFHLNRLAAFSGLYFMFEEILTAYCGDHREANLFCLRAKDAPGIVTKFKDFIRNDGQTWMNDSFHYAGLNIHALQQFGSLEIRTMRGCMTANEVIEWVAILKRLYDYSEKFADPRQAVSQLSGEGWEGFLRDVFGEYTKALVEGSGFDSQKLRESILEGVRYAQDICYCRDWSRYAPVDINKDPFGRNENKVMAAAAASPQPLPLQLSPGQFTTTAQPFADYAPDPFEDF